jgi:hypothetical protein
VVENIGQGDPGQFMLRVLGGDRLRHLVNGPNEQRYYTVPWPVADYDTCPDVDALSAGLTRADEAVARLRGRHGS